ncbi:hypothetical protein [Gillisia sp. Hel_I_29]|uniref:hypothetical protein n=1 Tax=Gillisia sp. Hel_I_29 TaxID=1249975 RepID=UPI000550019D|nr:hypothetical protein [Gillisia sp. Hel_I_29]
MKKFFIIYLLIITSISCSTNDDTSAAKTSINPPDWIHGSWKVENVTNNTSGFQFTSNDIILLSGSVNISHKEQIATYSNIDYDISVKEWISNDDYSVDFNYPQGMSVIIPSLRSMVRLFNGITPVLVLSS